MTPGAWLTPIIVPPVDLAVLALLALLFGARRTTLLLLAALLALAVPAVSDALLDGLSVGPGPAGAGVAPGATAEAILVLGGDLDRDGDGRPVPGPLTLGRLREAAALARRTGLPIAVTGGPISPGGPPVGDVMATSLRDDFGVAPRWVENRSLDTWGNARRSAALLVPQGVHRVLLVTDSWHVARAQLAFRTTALSAVPAPVRRIGAVDHGGFASALVPRVAAWQRSHFALHEWIGLLWYHLRAWTRG